jgi:hypothetical protein
MDVLLAISNVVSLVLNIWVVSTVVGVLTAVQILRGLFSKRGQVRLEASLLHLFHVQRWITYSGHRIDSYDVTGSVRTLLVIV